MSKNTVISYAGKVAIVTGGASGMGAAVARIIVEAEGSVVIADLNEAMGSALAAELGPKARFVLANITRVEDTQKIAQAAIGAFGRIDVLFNNAGKGGIADVLTLEPKDWHDFIDVNLTSAFLMTKAVLPHIKAAGGGAIVNTASISGLSGDYGMIAYNAAKGGLVNLTRALALDHAKDNIRVNAVCPGVISDTTMAAAMKDAPGGVATWAARIPMRRTGLSVELGRVMAFLGSDLASYMTGSVIVVDGGLTSNTGVPTPDDFAAAAAAEQGR